MKKKAPKTKKAELNPQRETHGQKVVVNSNPMIDRKGRFIRSAVVQLRCLPAFVISGVRYSGDPFASNASAANLASIRSIPGVFGVGDLIRKNEELYDEWAIKRLEAIWAELKHPNVRPDFIVFPEGAISLKQLVRLSELYRESDDWKPFVVAGSHTFVYTKETREIYVETLGMSDKTLQEIQQSELCHNNIVPILCQFKGSKKSDGPNVSWRIKTHLSIFEVTGPSGHSSNSVEETEDTRSRLEDHIYHVDLEPFGSLDVAVYVCSELLQNGAIPRDGLDVALVASYHQTGTRDYFRAILDYFSDNRILTCYANEGSSGNSGAFMPVDSRLNTWWFNQAPTRRVLPPGDAILITDSRIRGAAEIAVVNPDPGARLVRINSIFCQKDQGRCAKGSELLLKAYERFFEPSEGKIDFDEVNAFIECVQEFLEEDGPDAYSLIHYKLKRVLNLMKDGSMDNALWNVHGHEIIVNGQRCFDKIAFEMVESTIAHIEVWLRKVSEGRDAFAKAALEKAWSFYSDQRKEMIGNFPHFTSRLDETRSALSPDDGDEVQDPAKSDS